MVHSTGVTNGVNGHTNGTNGTSKAKLLPKNFDTIEDTLEAFCMIFHAHILAEAAH